MSGDCKAHELSMLSQRKPEHVAPTLLALLEKARGDAIGTVNENNHEIPLESKFKEIETKLGNWRTLFPNILHWEGKFMERFRAVEQQLDDNIFKEHDKVDEVRHRLELINKSVVSIEQLFLDVERQIVNGESTKPLQGQQSSFEDAGGSGQENMSDEQHLEKEKFASKTFLKFERCFDSLESYQLKACYLCLSIFPENSIIKKKPLIYWWLGEGLISKTNGRTAEEVGEEVFEELISEGFLIPKRDHSSPTVKSCVVHPLARRTLMFLAKRLQFFDFDSRWTNPVNGYNRAFLFSRNSDSYTAIDEETLKETLTVFNLSEQYLHLGDLLSKLNSVQVLQLGRWQDNVKHHIEVENEDSTFDPQMKKKAEDEAYLNSLGAQTSLRYLSLRGISRITSLPPSVAKLRSLEILDLRDCQGLQKLPFDISSLENLTHLDLSECYLLEIMPKGIEKLSALQVLKGFVIGNARKDPCKLSDLVQLAQLRKLSIRNGNEASGEDYFESFKDFRALQILVISWSGANVSINSFTVPPKLKKLELWCAHFDTTPTWLRPDQLQTLEKLYIRGGKLSTLCDKSGWRVKILILKYLKEFKDRQQELLQMFPELDYLELQYNKDDPRTIWSKAQEEKATNN